MDSNRRKRSCAGCARAKRRCMGGNPCHRCTRQRKRCENQQQCPQLIESTVAIREDHTHPQPDRVDAGPASVLPNLNFRDFLNHPTLAACVSEPSTTMHVTGVGAAVWNHANLLPATAPLSIMQPHPPDLLNPSLDLALTVPFIEAEGLATFAISNITAAQRSRIEYPIRVIKEAPSMFACENRTWWSHALLWEDAMPKCLQEAQAACAFHMSRNTINDAFVSRHIEHKVSGLLDLPPAMDLHQSLAQVQALVLYLTILLSSPNNHCSHTQTSIALLHLEILALTLRSFLLYLPVPDTPTHLPLHPLRETRDFFYTWIWYESATRTYGIACFLLITTYILRGNGSRCSLHSTPTSYADLSFPNSRVTLLPSLWSAKSALDFANTWNNNIDARLEVFGIDFKHVMEKTKWTQMDNFGRMLLVSVLGEDEVNGWRESKGDGNFHNSEALYRGF